MKQKFQFGPWFTEYDSNDGARLNSLQYNDIDILTQEPRNFKVPKNDFGRYETRPVYGYDDCFPSVEESKFPNSDWLIPDHGELCWLPWKTERSTDTLTFSVKSQKIPVTFERKMRFENNQLVWSFTVDNFGNVPIPFQYVMHPLMPLSAITDVKLPEFESVFDDIKKKRLPLSNSKTMREFLLAQQPGSTNMLFIQNISEGKLSWELLNKIKIELIFSKKLFPTIGVWWNYDSYPDEEDCRRNECALEPIPGMNSTLLDAFNTKDHLTVQPGKMFQWEVVWRISA